jgi:cytochrome P450
MSADVAVAERGAGLPERMERFFALDEEMLADPFTLYKEMRETHPVMRVGNVVAVSRYGDIKRIFRDPLTFSSRRHEGTRVTSRRASLEGADRDKYDALLRHERGQLGLLDMPEHTRLRLFVNQVFSRAVMATMRDVAVQTANELLDSLGPHR